MKKVLFVIATLYGGGAERALSNIVTHFPDDWEIDILLNNDKRIEFPYKGNILSLSLPGFEKKKSFGYFIREVIKRTCCLRKIKKHNNYDACISFLDSANISNVFSGNKYCKTIVSVRNDMIAKESSLLYKISAFPLIKLLYNHADKIIAVSNEIEVGLIRRLKISEDKVQTIVNGYDCQKIQQQMRIFPCNGIAGKDFIVDNRKVVVTVGRIMRQKGQWHLVRAFSEVVKREPQALLLIVGSGLLEQYLADLIKDYSLEKNVILVGYSDNPYWYNAIADVFILPSIYEGYPNALAEAVCCGTPCIATDFHSGAREILAPGLNSTGERVEDILEEEYGVLVPMCSGRMYKNKEELEPEERKMAEAIIMLLSDSEKRQYYKQKSIERSRDLDINSIVTQWIEIIKEDKKDIRR